MSKFSLAIIFTFLFTRIPLLGWDFINVDAPAWDYRATQFYSYLKTLNFAETYRTYHPGVTIMWLGGFGIEVFNQIYKFFNATRAPYYDYKLFPWLNFSQTFPVVLADLFLVLLAFKLLARLTSSKISFIFSLLLVLEPFFVANTRTFHLDGLMTLLMLCSTLSLLAFYKDCLQKKYLIFSGVLAGLAVLTKVSSFIIIPFNALWILIFSFRKELKIKYAFKYLVNRELIFLFSTLLCIFALFPAMWVRPVEVVTKIINNGIIGTGQAGQPQYFLDRNTMDPGPLFYLYMLAFRISPICLMGLMAGVVWGVVKLIKSPKKFLKLNYLTVFIIFAGLYFLQMSLSSKKIDRYILPLIPAICIFIVTVFRDFLEKRFKWVIIVLVSQFLILSFSIFPDYFNYANPALGGLRPFLNVFGAMDWGAGYYKVANYLNHYPNVSEKSVLAAFNDQSIEPYFKGITYQIDSVDFDQTNFIVLPPYSDYEKVAISKGFKLINTIKYNGVGFWFIYENKL